MKRIFFIDLENVGKNGLREISSLTSSDKVVLFHGQHYHGEKVSDEIVQKISMTAATVENIIVKSYKKNAMDFQIVSYLGYLIGLNEADAMYYIVSEDTGYGAAIEFFNNKTPNIFVKQIKSVEDIIDNQKIREQIASLLKDHSKKVIKVTSEAICGINNLKDFHNVLNSRLPGVGQKIYPLVKDVFMEIHHIEKNDTVGDK